MKIFLSVLSVAVLFSCATGTAVIVPAGKSVEIENTKFKTAEFTLKNRSNKSLEVKVLEKNSGKFLRGFGLGIGNAKVLVEDFGQLQLKNNSAKKVKIRYKMAEKIKLSTLKSGGSVNFYLTNDSAKSIPLVIPNVMNPNLSPFSKSGVKLKYGQKIFFKKGIKKHLLLEVDESVKPEQKIEVSSLLKKRKAELGL